MDKDNRLIVALDLASGEEALEVARNLYPQVDFFKVGLELFIAGGRPVVTELREMGARVFLDLKFHDIYNTVTRAAAAATRLGVDMLTIHASGGREMMTCVAQSVREEAGRLGQPAPLVLAVTVLTTTTKAVLNKDLGIAGEVQDQVLRLATMAQEAGVDGVVASPLEVTALRRACGPDFSLVTPGVRPTWAQTDDQKRFMTPGEAIAAGSDYLVVGRPITRAQDPVAAAAKVQEEMEASADAQ